MNKPKYLFFFFLLYPILLFSQGKVTESIVMKSKILSKEVRYSIYLPEDYETSHRSYPVLFLLHGYTDDETAWIQFGEVQKTADKLISQGEIPPMIIVMPDAGKTWYVNDYKGQILYEDMFIKEFIPYVENIYRIRKSKEFRAVGGLSMGGFGALYYAMKHPDLFSSCIALSAGVHVDSTMIRKLKAGSNNLVEVFGPMKGDSLPEYWKENNILTLAENCSVNQLSSVHYYIDCGDKDALIVGNSTLNNIFMRRKIPHEFRVRSGEHNWTYWRTGIIEGLIFAGNYFHR